MKAIKIGRINDSPGDFKNLCRLWHEAMACPEGVAFEFASCDFLRPNALVFLGGLARVLQARGTLVEFRWDTLQDTWVRTSLMQNGFMNHFGDQCAPWQGNCIPFREDVTEDPKSFQDYLSQHWLGRGWIGVSPALKDAITAKVAETYLNAFEHSKSAVGVLACGQYFQRQNDLMLSLADFGVGIPSNVRLHLSDNIPPESLRGAACMEWALVRGNSTAQTRDISRGVGLDLLRDFVRTCGGTLEIFSHDGGYRLVDKHETYHNITAPFEGTLVNIRLPCNDTYYVLASENVSVVPF